MRPTAAFSDAQRASAASCLRSIALYQIHTSCHKSTKFHLISETIKNNLSDISHLAYQLPNTDITPHLPTPNSRQQPPFHPHLNTQYSHLNTHISILNTHISILTSHYSYLRISSSLLFCFRWWRMCISEKGSHSQQVR